MAITVKDSRKPMTPAPEGMYQAVCCDVVDLGLQETQWGDKEMVRLVWQLDLGNPETGKRFTIHSRYTASLNEKSNLYKHLKAWRGKAFTKAELDGFDLEQLLGANCQIQVVHNTKDEITYANVNSIVPLGKGQIKLKVMDYLREQEREGYEPPRRRDVEEAGNGGAAVEDDDLVPF